MGDLILTFGFFIVLAGFLLNIPIVAALYLLVTKPLFKKYRGSTKGALIVSVLFLILVLLLSYIPGAIRFESLCKTYGQPVLGKVEAADTYYVDAYYVWIHKKSEELLKSGRLAFIEGKNNLSRDLPYKRVRFDKNGKRVEEQVASLASEYGLRMRHDMEFGIQSTTREFYQIADDRVISSFTTFDYMGGPLAWLVQPWGSKACPDYEDEWFELSYKELALISFGLENIE